MLILTRKSGETLRIGDNIKVRVLGIKGGQVRIGIEAPGEVPVHREEVHQRIYQAQQTQTEELEFTLDLEQAQQLALS